MLAAPLLGWVILRAVRRMDELMARQQLEAVVFACGGTALLSFGYGFLEGVAYPRLSMFWVWPVMCVLFAIGQVLAHRRYAA